MRETQSSGNLEAGEYPSPGSQRRYCPTALNAADLHLQHGLQVSSPVGRLVCKSLTRDKQCLIWRVPLCPGLRIALRPTSCLLLSRVTHELYRGIARVWMTRQRYTSIHSTGTLCTSPANPMNAPQCGPDRRIQKHLYSYDAAASKFCVSSSPQLPSTRENSALMTRVK